MITAGQRVTVATGKQVVAADDETRAITSTIALAQVHATLALAAATAIPAVIRQCGNETGIDREWAGVA